jgi:peptidoglycan/LPS O-acetylase OafA/YrhL
MGVDLFFVISGVVITLSAHRQGDAFSAGAFLRERFWRVFPAYWAALALTLAIALVMAQAGMGSRTMEKVSGGSLLASLVLAPAPLQIMPVAWTLALEITFYALFALSYGLFRLPGVVAALALWAGWAMAYTEWLHAPGSMLTLLGHTVVLEFLFGVAIGAAILSGRKPLGRTALGLGAISFAFVLFGGMDAFGLDLQRQYAAGVPAALLVYGAVTVRLRAPGWLTLGGEASYILYLVHTLCFAVAAKAYAIVFGGDLFADAAATTAAVAGAVAAALILTIWVERPFNAWRKSGLRSVCPTDAPAQRALA